MKKFLMVLGAFFFLTGSGLAVIQNIDCPEMVGRGGTIEGSCQYEMPVGSGVVSDHLLLPGWKKGPFSVTLVPAGTAKVQYSTDTIENILASSITWQDWPAGDVTVTTTDVLYGPVTVLRIVSTTGTAVMRVTQY